MTTHEDTGAPGAPPVEAPAVDRPAAAARPAAAPAGLAGGKRALRASAPGGVRRIAQARSGAATGTAPSWWHRSHPVFTRLSGFFTGMVLVVVVPSGFAALLSKLLSYDDAAQYFPYLAVVLVVPIVLIAVPRTRRFGVYMLVGMLATAAVVAVAGGITLYVLLNH